MRKINMIKNIAKRGESDIYLVAIFLLFGLLLIFLIIVSVINVSEAKKCNNACKDALFYEKHSDKSSGFLEDLLGKSKIYCICYYEDGTKTKIIGGKK